MPPFLQESMPGQCWSSAGLWSGAVSAACLLARLGSPLIHLFASQKQFLENKGNEQQAACLSHTVQLLNCLQGRSLSDPGTLLGQRTGQKVSCCMGTSRQPDVAAATPSASPAIPITDHRRGPADAATERKLQLTFPRTTEVSRQHNHSPERAVP